MPKQVLIHNLSHPGSPALRAEYGSSFWRRMRGLMFRRSLPEGWGLLMVQSRDSRADASIHMFFVPMDLAVIWINTAREVVDVQLARSWRPAYWPQAPARYVLETTPEHLSSYNVGDRLEFEETTAV
jgi:uncharacterized membrane protein (UPF0127 family)